MDKMFRISQIVSFFIFIAYFILGSTVMAIEDPSNLGTVKSINFDEVLKIAKEHSYDLQIADYNILIAKQGIRNAKSEYFPKLNLGAGTEYTKNFRDLTDSTIMSIGDAFINPYTRYQSILGVTVAYNLFDFGVRGNNLKIAKEEVNLKELETKQKYQDLSLTLLDAYTKVLVTSKQININKEILSLEEKNLEAKERLFKAKETSKTDLNDSRVKVYKIKNRISELKAIRAESLNWLSFYTGLVFDNDIDVDDIKKSNYNVLAFNDYTKTLVWQIHEKNIRKKELELKVAKCNYLPKLNVYGKYYLYGSNFNSYAKSLSVEPSNFSVGASLNMPVFDGFKNSSLVQKTMLELKQLYIERDKAIAEYATKLANMRSNLMFLDEQVAENKNTIKELTDKENSIKRLAAKKLVSVIDENDVKISLLEQKIEFEKNNTTQFAIIRGIQILTEEN